MGSGRDDAKKFGRIEETCLILQNRLGGHLRFVGVALDEEIL